MGIKDFFDKKVESGWEDVYVAKDENEKNELIARLRELGKRVDEAQVPEITE